MLVNNVKKESPYFGIKGRYILWLFVFICF